MIDDGDPARKYLPKTRSSEDPARKYLPKPDVGGDRRSVDQRIVSACIRVLLFFVFVPPVGLVMMLIECPSRRLELTDYVLALIVPLFGHAKFFMC